MMKSKIKVLLTLLLAGILIIQIPLQAGEMASNQHVEMINNYVDKLTLIQRRIFTLAPKIIFDGEGASEQENANGLKILTDTLDTIDKELGGSLSPDTDENFSDRDILLLLNAINYMKSSLFELKLLNTQTAISEKMTTLERYFNFRIYANNSIGLVSRLVNNT